MSESVAGLVLWNVVLFVLALGAFVGVIAIDCRTDDIEHDIDSIHLEATIEAGIEERLRE